jgi:predicted alpha-1,2-mannosidase
MATRRASRRAALALAVAVIPAGLLAVGWQGTTSARAAGTPAGTGAGAGVCTKTASGEPANCPRPVLRSRLPAGVKDNARLATPVSNPAALVDTRTWTSGGGNTYPGAEVPFGEVQWSPDTMPDRSDGGGYTFGDKQLTGYSLTHISGSGCRGAGDVPILPMTGALPAGNPSAVTTSFTNSGETAQAGYYSARSNGPDTITSAFSATAHAAIGQFTFPRTKTADFLIKLRDSELPDVASTATVVGHDEISGSETSGGFCNETVNVGPYLYTVYFDIVFNRPFSKSQVITEHGQADPNSVFLTFNTMSNQVIDAKVAISYVSVANARLNWQTDIPGWSLSSVKATAQSNWNSLLSEISVSGGSYAETQEFYSLLYKDFLQPNIISDVNGQYLGSDMLVDRLQPGQSNQYSMFSGWDIYHSLAQLQAMLDPTAADDMAQSLVNFYGENSILPQWGYLNLDNYAQVGDPADAIIADYYAFGATQFDTASALADMLSQANTVNTIRPGEKFEARYGYLPLDGTYGCCYLHRYVSALLEYDTADFALSQFAAALGDSADATKLQQRADNWANLFDPSNGLLTGRYKNHKFLAGVTPTTTTNYCEGTAQEYLWDVPNDYAGLFADLGGNAKVRPELRKYLSEPNGYGIYAQMSNEFDLGEQNAPDYAGDPSLTELAVNTIRRQVFAPGPFGLDNNDDLGAESSQFIWEMLGMYPENPGSGDLVFASPGFQTTIIHLPSGSTIRINAPGAGATNFYVKSLTINGTSDSQLYVPFSTLSAGATLDWTLSSKATAWGTAAADAPPSYGPTTS